MFDLSRPTLSWELRYILSQVPLLYRYRRVMTLLFLIHLNRATRAKDWALSFGFFINIKVPQLLPKWEIGHSGGHKNWHPWFDLPRHKMAKLATCYEWRICESSHSLIHIFTHWAFGIVQTLYWTWLNVMIDLAFDNPVSHSLEFCYTRCD